MNALFMGKVSSVQMIFHFNENFPELSDLPQICKHMFLLPFSHFVVFAHTGPYLTMESC